MDLIKACKTESKLDFLEQCFVLTEEQKQAVLQQRTVFWTNAMAEDLEEEMIETPAGVDAGMLANWTDDKGVSLTKTGPMTMGCTRNSNEPIFLNCLTNRTS